jgi:hypothetical protein
MNNFSFLTGEVGFDVEVFLVFDEDGTDDNGAAIFNAARVILVMMRYLLLRIDTKISFAQEREMVRNGLVNGVPEFGVARIRVVNFRDASNA